MNVSPTPSAPPPGTRQAMPISAMRLRGLPPRSREELDRLRALLRRRKLPGSRWPR
jgi:hypothetical protein